MAALWKAKIKVPKPEVLEKIHPIFQKSPKKSLDKKKLKVQNIYIKPLLKPYNTYNKPYFEHA